jgi:hypothetical protein
MGTFTGPKVVSDNLIFCIDAWNRSYAPGYALDISNQKNHAIRQNGTNHVTSGAKSYWSFDGTDDSLQTPIEGAFENDTGFTTEIWFASSKTTRQHIWNWGVSSSGNNLNFNVNDGAYHIWFYWEGNGSNLLWITKTDATNNGINLTDGNIHHAVFTHSGTTNKFYLDGVDVTSLMSTSGTQTMNNVNAGGRFEIGLTGTSSINFLGNCYQARVYKRALTSAEVIDNFKASRNRFGV